MEVAYIFLALLIVLMYGVTTWYSSIEGFEDGKSITYHDAAEIYDDTYASIYDVLWNSNEKMKYEEVSLQDVSLADWPEKVNNQNNFLYKLSQCNYYIYS